MADPIPNRALITPRLTSLAVLTLVFGATVAVPWLAIGGRDAFHGPDRVLASSWAAIYGLEAVLAAVAGALLVRRVGDRPSFIDLLAFCGGAWLGELLALTLFGGLLANEIHPDNAWRFWVQATGGPLQPIAAVLGGVAARLVTFGTSGRA